MQIRRKHNIFFGALLTGLIVGGLVALSPTAAQSEPNEFETVQAGVQGLFTATAQASAYSTFVLTVDVMFREAQTRTAVFAPTVTTTTTETASMTSTPMPGIAATETDAARIATGTAEGGATGTAFFQTPGSWSNGIISELERVDGGTFQMGTTPEEIAIAVNECLNQNGNCQIAFGEDSTPAHDVTVSGFLMERAEVTYQQYLRFLNALGAGSHMTGCDGQPCVVTRAENENSNIFFADGAYQVVPVINNFPVASVTWYGAKAYCRAIGRRLPTEAEWERAARGPNNYLYPWGNEWNPAFAKTSITPDESIGALAVGSLPAGASSFGIFDMAGNVAEWVSDWYDPTYYSNPAASGLDPVGPQASGDFFEKVVRGGSWDAKPFFARSVHRQSADPRAGFAWIGFRCVANLDAPLATDTLVPPVINATLPPATDSDLLTSTATMSPIPNPTVTRTIPPPPVEVTTTVTATPT